MSCEMSPVSKVWLMKGSFKKSFNCCAESGHYGGLKGDGSSVYINPEANNFEQRSRKLFCIIKRTSYHLP
jgi:hypothetical protein